jgi:ABC-type transport system involved in multi-copper enzyme maturation permease subunit
MKYVVMAALRDKLMIAMTVVLVVGASLAMFLGSAAIVEKSLFTLVFAGAGSRILVVLGMVLFVVFFIRRAFDSKEIEYLLSRPVGRLSIILSFALAFSALCVFLGLGVGACIFAVSPHMFGYSHVLWIVSIIAEMVIMANIALFFSMYISSASSATMATLGVYVLGRLMGQLLGIVDSNMVDSYGIFAMAMQMVSVITPRLDLLGQSSWLIYGVQGGYNLIFALCQGVFFSALVLLATSLDFVKREF